MSTMCPIVAVLRCDLVIHWSWIWAALRLSDATKLSTFSIDTLVTSLFRVSSITLLLQVAWCVTAITRLHGAITRGRGGVISSWRWGRTVLTPRRYISVLMTGSWCLLQVIVTVLGWKPLASGTGSIAMARWDVIQIVVVVIMSTVTTTTIRSLPLTIWWFVIATATVENKINANLTWQ